MIISDKLYNILKWLCLIFAPALVTRCDYIRPLSH